MAVSSPLHLSALPVALLFLLIVSLMLQVDGRPSQPRSDAQVLQDLFGVKIGSLVLAPSEVIEGSAEGAPPLSENGRGHRGEPPRVASRMFLDFLRRQRRVRGRSRKGVARGCFGMKVDRIGVISGLGC